MPGTPGTPRRRRWRPRLRTLAELATIIGAVLGLLRPLLVQYQPACTHIRDARPRHQRNRMLDVTSTALGLRYSSASSRNPQLGTADTSGGVRPGLAGSQSGRVETAKGPNVPGLCAMWERRLAVAPARPFPAMRRNRRLTLHGHDRRRPHGPTPC